VLFFDMFKGAFPVLLGIAASEPIGQQSMPLPSWLSLLADPAMQAEPYKTYVGYFILPAIAGILSMIGHSKSIFLKFQGGKSAATGLGTLGAMNPYTGLSMFAVFVSTIFIGRYVSVASMLAAAVGPFFMHYFTHGQRPSFVIYNIIGSSYVIIRHRSNIKRLLKGTEPKIGEKAPEVEKKTRSNNETENDSCCAHENQELKHSMMNENQSGNKKANDNSDKTGAILILLIALTMQQQAYSADSKADKAAAKAAKAVAKSVSKSSKEDKSDKSPTLPDVFTSAPPAAITPDEANCIRIYKTDSRAVVNVTTVGVATPESLIYGITPQGDTGSGAIISADGYILTNNHVVTTSRIINGLRVSEVAQLVRITLFDGTAYPAKVVGVDPDNDLAVLKIDPGSQKLSTLKFGDSSKLEVGRRVYAIGNPFGLDLTMTSGIISSVGRTMRTENGRVIKGVLQTDAAINPGNSGGPLLDSQGNMIGVTTAILSKNQQSAGIGFAIPINVVKRIVPQLIAHGAVLRPDLGINQVKPLNMGLMVWWIDAKGPAAEA
ncbi:MAG: glycerol-3-phosphate acyltransferase, partial [Candidatus Obscuribacterales bacterium]|nr:glycerol-3-phosphate acyltransferase [Candidatus Obscuribacterales bacterium]